MQTANFLLSPRMLDGVKGPCGVSYNKSADSIHEDGTPMTSTPPKGPAPHPFMPGICFNI